jgi:V8-like Glu-specific endopeptidase
MSYSNFLEKDFRMKISSLLILASLILSSHLIASTKGVDVIYGEDNRKDVYDSTNASFIELSRSTAAMISSKNLKTLLRGETEISGSTLQARGICQKERFSQQISAANCSGFLVDGNKLVTAGHCIKSEADCKSYKWVFDYKVDHADQANVNVPTSSVYSCKKIISRKLDSASKDDYAFIELDRKVTDRHPVKLRKSGKVANGAALVVIGHPTGLPTKISDGANVRSLQRKFFVANLDTYGGNSGSAVFNVKTGEVEGILVRGETDYVYSNTLGCQISNVCSNDGCRGEDVTYITNVEGLKDIQ